MRTLIVLLILTVVSTTSRGQHMWLSMLSEYTIAGPQYGAAILMETNKKLGAGLFYQADIQSPAEVKTNNTFYGLQLQIPLAKSEKINFFGTVRGGLVNDKFAVIVPGVETRINAGKRLAVGFAMSMRMNYPSVLGKLTYRIF
ncbi:MAG TPA: hypothetical protein VEB86_14630 [Chryseosolibacter sp.]|nr:hypothetical protein [Chryseosolibacter sp.]